MGVLSSLLSAAGPLLVGCLIAYLINILMSFYERHYFPKSSKKAILKSRRPVCLLAAFLTMLAIIALVIGLIAPQLVSCIALLFAKLPGVLEVLSEKLSALPLLSEDIAEYLTSIDWESIFEKAAGYLTSGIGGIMDTLIGAVSSVFSGVTTAVLGIIFSIYILCGKEKLDRQLGRLSRRYLKNPLREKLSYLFHIINDCFHKYIVGQCIEAVILGSLCTIGMLILGIPYATMIGALVAFMALIPVAGAFIAAGVGAVMILTVSPIKALIFLIFFVILQQLEGNLIYPRVVGSSIGLPGIWVLAAVTIGGSLMGIFGMLFFVPLSAALYRLIKTDVNRKEENIKENAKPELPEK